MAEQVTEVTHGHTADDTQSTDVACASTPDEGKRSDNNLSLTQMADSSSVSKKSEDKYNGGKNVTQAGNNTGDDHTGKMKAPETITVDNQVDGPNLEDTNTEAAGGDDGQECGLLPEGMDLPEDTTLPQTVLPEKSEKKNSDKQRNTVEATCNTSKETAGPTLPDSVSSNASTSEDENDDNDNTEQAGENRKEEQKTFVETIGSTSQEATELTFSENTGIFAGKKRYLIAIVVVFAIVAQYLREAKTPPQTNELQQIDIFLKQLEKVKTQFPNQRGELWNRSRIHLKRHLQTAHPTEPVSLILTAGIRAERSLHCLAQGLASAFSFALNASVLHIDGASKASQDSDMVKLEIDEKLQGAFKGDKPVAVIHRLEELPPGSTLIFYRYCDHENAAFKNTFLIFTVLLGEEEAIPADIRLTDVEEMVDDHLQKKFLSHGHPVSFDKMDLDKYGGLWSRISHLILPVTSEERFERDGCEET